MASLRSINQDDLRNHNLSVVLDSLLRATEPMSRADLAKKTGLTKAAMSVLVSLMLDMRFWWKARLRPIAVWAPQHPLEIKGGRCAAWDCRPTPTVMARWCSILTVPLWGAVGRRRHGQRRRAGDFRPSRRTGFAAGRSACQERLCACRYRFGIAGSRHR